MIFLQKWDTEYINSLRKEESFFIELRHKHIFDGMFNETVILIQEKIQLEIVNYGKNYGIDFETGQALSANPRSEPQDKGNVTRDADSIFA